MNNSEAVIYITNVPTPYKIAMLNGLAERIRNFNVFFMAETEYIRRWDSVLSNAKFKYDICNSIEFKLRKREWVIYVSFSIFLKIIRSRPDVIIFAPYTQPYILGILLSKFLFKSKTILWAESPFETGKYKGKIAVFLKRTLVNFMDAIVVPGTRAMNSMMHVYKISKDRLFLSPHSVNNSYFSCESKKCREREHYWRKRLNLNQNNILYVGQLIERKNVITLIKAYQALNRRDISLFIVGDGPLKEYLRTYCQNNRLEGVQFIPNLQQNELVRYYTLCDVLVLPSHEEVWGLVVNESMACGTPAICSRAVTSAYDLIIPSKTGFFFDPDDFCDLKNKLVTFYKERDKVNFKHNVSDRVKDFTPQRMAIGFLDAIDFCYKRRFVG